MRFFPVRHRFFKPYLKPGEGPIVLVLAPTRELAVQIKEECDKFGASSDIKNTVVYGGVKKHTQIHDLRSGMEIVIATPGRLIDHLEQGNTNLRRVTYLVSWMWACPHHAFVQRCKEAYTAFLFFFFQ